MMRIMANWHWIQEIGKAPLKYDVRYTATHEHTQ